MATFRMNIHHVLFLCFMSGALCDGNTGTLRCIQGTEGGSVRVECSMRFVEIGSKFFCKEECKGDNVLVQTFGFNGQNGRYSLEYDYYSRRLYVRITQLMKSDTGQYMCEVRRPLFPNSRDDFEVRVADASTAETNKVPTDLLLVLVACVPVVVIVLLAVVLLLLCKKRTKHSDGSNKRENTGSPGTEIVLYENCPPLSTRADSTYQSLDPATMNQDHIYCTLTQNTNDNV